jgi:hypothetical protein
MVKLQRISCGGADLRSTVEHEVSDPDIGEVTFRAVVTSEGVQARLYAFGLKKLWNAKPIAMGEEVYELFVEPLRDQIALCEVAYAESTLLEVEVLGLVVIILHPLKTSILAEFLRWVEELSLRTLQSPVSSVKLLMVAGSLPIEVLERLGYRKADGFYLKNL